MLESCGAPRRSPWAPGLPRAEVPSRESAERIRFALGFFPSTKYVENRPFVNPMRAILLGTSGAWPIPRPGCHCPQCTEARAHPALRRTRSALYIASGGENVLVDAGPDVFAQFEREGLSTDVTRVFITHTHMDHVLGLDDLVHLRNPRERPLLVHASPEHQERLCAIFPHLLRAERPRIAFEPWAAGVRVPLDGGVVLEGFETGHRDRFATTAPVLHLPDGKRVAHATDMGDVLPPSPALQDVDLFVGDATYLGGPGYGHPGTDEALAMARGCGARRIALTHLGHVQVADADLRARLGPAVHVCRDGDDLLELLGAETPR